MRVFLGCVFALWAGAASAQQVYVSPPSRGQIPGGTGTPAAAGNIGEKICAPSNCTLIPCTTTTGYSSPIAGVNIASNTLTPGTWRIEGWGGVDASSGTVNIFQANLSTTNGGGAGGVGGYAPGTVSIYYGAAGAYQAYVPPQIVTLTTSTVYYITDVYVTLSAGTAGICGGWVATRIQ